MSPKEQAREVGAGQALRKRRDPRPDHGVARRDDPPGHRRSRARKDISGVPVVEGEKVVGIVTNRDLRFETQLDAPVSSVMTPKRAARHRARRRRQGRSARRCCTSTASRRCWSSTTAFELARHDHRQGHPEGDRHSRAPARTSAARCASAPRSAPAPTPRSASQRCVEAGVDVVVVDTAHGHSQGRARPRALGQGALSARRRSSAATSPRPRPRRRWSTQAPTRVKVGIGPGSICTTRIVAGVGVPQITAIDERRRRRSRAPACR